MVQENNVTQHNERPASFDARVMACVPGLRKFAKRYVYGEYLDDLITDTVIFALDKWQNFREDGDMWHWLVWTMRGILRNNAEKAYKRRRLTNAVSLEDYMHPACAPRQEDVTFAGEVVNRLSRSREGRMLLRLSTGETLAEVGKRRGIGAERVRQLTDRARTKIKKVAA